MRATAITLLILTSVCLSAQPRDRRATFHNPQAASVETQVKQATLWLGDQKKEIDRDLHVLSELRTADDALTDPMQPSVALQKALDHISKAETFVSDFPTRQGIVRIRQQLEAANRSPASADFGRLRTTLQGEAIRPAARVVAQLGAKLTEDSLAWLTAQELIAGHLRQLTETAAECLRETTKEK
ncbi:MAG TPA: hypothetical protein VHW00_11990 [Thermoanaerobaculia bacterium]|nr:hypothetical protein [Thermoanaerobaculia bacterium]